MLRNGIWIVFLLIIIGSTLWFVFRASYEVYSYFQLSISLPVTVDKWRVEEVKSDTFAIVAHYSYEFGGKNYQGEDRLRGSYPNPWAANKAQKQLTTRNWSLWINPKEPQQAVLEKKFPTKRTISAAILLGLLGYFLILGIYVRGKK